MTKDKRVVETGQPARPELTNVTQIATGAGYSLALREDGIVLGWSFGSSSPAAVVASNATEVAVGEGYSIVLKRDGTVLAWGNIGQADVPQDLTNALHVSAGENHSLAVKADGTVSAWGDNYFGQCSIPAGLSDVVAVAGGATHSLALKRDGTVVAWGSGYEGQTNIPPSVTNVVAIAAGGAHSLALRADGTVVGWGWNGFGQLSIPEQGTNFIAISAQTDASYALTRLPVITVEPTGLTVQAGTNIVLNTGAVGNESWSWQWQRNGQKLPGATTSPLFLTNVQVWASGPYSVLLQNQWGSLSSSTAVVSVLPNPPTITIEPTNQVVLSGGSAVFAASADGAPPFSFQWFFNAGALPGATNSLLLLTNATDLNAGRYQLVVSNAYGTNLSWLVWLTVNNPPVFTNAPRVLELPAGTNYVLSAFATGTQPIAYQWYLDSAPIPGATNASLLVTNVQRPGEFSLLASNAFGIGSSVYLIDVVASAPFILKQPLTQSVIEGNNATLRVISSGSTPLAFQWSHKNVQMTGATNELLEITNVSKSDTGAYFVVVSNSFGSATSADAQLVIGDPYGGLIDPPLISFTQVTTQAFDHPVFIANASDEKLFVVEQSGRIRIVSGNKIVEPPFLDISERVFRGGEQGLMSLAFPAGFHTNAHFYVVYSRQPDRATVLSRFSVGTDQNLADPSSEQILLVLPQPGAVDNRSIAAFGPEGYLYLSTGDGSDWANAQNTASLLGKMLRINVEGGVNPYSIPPDNPFVTNASFAGEIWALGFKNPTPFTFDRLTSDIYIGDRGYSFQEVDYIGANSGGGQNFGWPILDGPSILQPPGTNATVFTPPVTFYSTAQGASIVGGYVYRGPSENRMNGLYFFTDLVSRRLWALKGNSTNWLPASLGTSSHAIKIFGEDNRGLLYAADAISGQLLQMYDTEQALTPTLRPSGGSFSNDVQVTVLSETPGAIIHYTMDGRDPSEFDPAVSSGATIQVSASVVLKIRTYRDDLYPSSVAQGTFSLQAAAPQFSPAGGSIPNVTTLIMSSVTAGATLVYTLDGSDPSLASPAYSGPLTINGNTTVRAKATRVGYDDSSITSVFFPWAVVPTPVINPASGVITNGTVAGLSCGLPGAEIHYTIDGSEPDLSSALYTGPFAVFGNSTLQAEAWKIDYHPSDVATANFRLLDYKPTVVRTYAGNTTRGFLNGPALQAMFNTPQGVCVDTQGALYVADTGNHLVRKISANREVVTFAGSGNYGAEDGIGTNATFWSPTGLTFDPAGNLYVADSGDNRLRRITPDGVVSTVLIPYDPNKTPVLWQPVVGTDGFIYVGGWIEILKTDPNGNFTSFAGPGVCCPTPGWTSHIGLAPAPDGGLFATANSFEAYFSYGRVVQISTSGQDSVYAGDMSGFSDGPRLIARFENPLALTTCSNGTLIVSDWTRVRLIETNGWVRTLAGTGEAGYQNGPGKTATFNSLCGIAADASGNIYVADSGNNCIRQICPDTFGIGIADAWQLQHFGVVGIDPNGDPDGDGMSNQSEYLGGTDPRDPTSCLKLLSIRDQGNAVVIQWKGGTNIVEHLQRSTALGVGAWTDIFSIAPSSPLRAFLDSGTNSASFYRVTVGWQ